MTIYKGSKMQSIDIQIIKNAFIEKGYNHKGVDQMSEFINNTGTPSTIT